ncbi:MarR family winged helix-turn-helix transcriptional regulator [Paenibacillus sp. S150]|uniref:MarR family winged helix-turn-helix transcriptional regulator n=1 Tax=Paenibacillus sp. S150 TaxID=2749826 RepID=UPI001C595356|nr:MarR family transcriptional regulator [Paenibacillus sp. S150]MBW4083412.1 MarR family transcriptional regulator [Paenibacillus sp. S150]
MKHNKSIGLAIRMLSIQIVRSIDSAVPKTITGLQGHVIDFIQIESAHADVFQKDVEIEFNIRRSTATGILQSMEKKDLIRRETVPGDARLKKIVLTDKALGIHKQIISKLAYVEEQFKNNLTEDEINMFFDIVERVSTNISNIK